MFDNVLFFIGLNMKLSALFFVTFLFISMGANAHGPTPKKVDETIVIDASVDKVWEVIKDFDKISEWHPDIKSSKGDGKNESGGERTLTLENGDLVESLDFYSESDHEYNYRLGTVNTDAMPVSSYTAALQLIDEDGKTKVKWKGRFYRGDTGNTPPEKLNDESAVKAMNSFIQNGLKGLKEKVE